MIVPHLALPRLLVGCERLGSVLPLATKKDRAEVTRQLDGALGVGYRGFDLAASYQLGGAERAFGEWLATQGARNDLFLVGKGGHPYPIVKPNRLHPNDVLDDLTASLERLNTPYFDLYLLHRDHPEANLLALAQALDRAVRSGLVKAIGASNWTPNRIAAFNAVADRHKLPRFTVSSPQFSLAVWKRPQFPGCVSLAGDAAALSFYQRTQTPVLAWSPLGRGYFARQANPVYDTPANQERRNRVESMARDKGTEPTTIALAYVLSQPFPTSAVVASSQVDKMRRNWNAARLTLTGAECRWLEAGIREQPIT